MRQFSLHVLKFSVFFIATIVLPHSTCLAQSAPLASLSLPAGKQIVDYDVSNDGAASWLIVKNGQNHELQRWQFEGDKVTILNAPPQLSLQAVAVHPADNNVYLLTRSGTGISRIERLDLKSPQWKTQVLYESPKPLRRLMISAAKLSPSYLQSEKSRDAHRIYFAQNSTKGWTTYSIRDDGSAVYSLAGSDIVPLKKDDEWEGSPFQQSQASTLPASLHPSGLAMLLQDDKSCFSKLTYHTNDWGKDAAFKKNICGGFLAWSRNGLYLQHWRKASPGVTLYSTVSDESLTLLPELQISAPPSSLPDGQHLLVLTEDSNKLQSLQKYAVSIPAGDIANAWMFVHDAKDVQALAQHGGVFRPIEFETWKKPQMFSLYDAEAYQCYPGTEVPRRPYLVTTDLFWENVAAAYEGLFILHERHAIMPALDQFLLHVVTHYAVQTTHSPLARVLLTAAVVRNKNFLNKVPQALRPALSQEVQKIEKAEASSRSAWSNEVIDYTEFKPRGHYDGNEVNSRYFRAVRYLAMQKLSTEALQEISTLPTPLTAAALSWAKSYDALVPESRSPFAWTPQLPAAASYAREAEPQAKLFPLAWGFDNEIFHNTTYRQNWPKELQISPDSPRLLPSGLDLAAVLGSDLAFHLLQPEIKKHPQLAIRLKALREQAGRAVNPNSSLYNAWVSTLANEFATPPDSVPAVSKELWKVKRLQTGLASWATLRHATVLVNDMVGVQGGQGGFVFETVQHAPPRGGVEPDVQAFQKMAQLMERIATTTQQFSGLWPKTRPVQDMSSAYIKRMQASAALLRQLADMTKRQNEGKVLSAKEYALIEKIGASAEHDFLLFKSVHNADGAVKEPDPIAKIADVARSNGGRLMAATGTPLEWDQSLGKAGARRMMRAAIYSYYEFTSGQPMTDAEWRSAEETTPRPAWVSQYLVTKPLACAVVR